MSLARFLQGSFAAAVPKGWRCSSEAPVFPRQCEKLLGFAPRADLLLENESLSRRVWIEFEISRADPAANHAKFSVGHLFLPQSPQDTFVSMVSAHVAIGRANLGAGAVLLMRRLGMNAFQVPLFPAVKGSEIKHWNHLDQSELSRRGIDVEPEIERVLTIVQPLYSDSVRRIFFASNDFEVAMNVMRWNEEMAAAETRLIWGRRTVTYFVYEPRTMQFAPSKFCAFIPVRGNKTVVHGSAIAEDTVMTVGYYASIDSAEHRFDGALAKFHLLHRLGYRLTRAEDSRKMTQELEKWLDSKKNSILVHPRGAFVLVPPYFTE